MKYLNSLVFLSLMVFVAGCQKKEQPQAKKYENKVAAQKQKVKKQGPTQLETKKSVAGKLDAKKVESAKKVQPKKVEPKKNVDKKDVKKSKDQAKK